MFFLFFFGTSPLFLFSEQESIKESVKEKEKKYTDRTLDGTTNKPKTIEAIGLWDRDSLKGILRDYGVDSQIEELEKREKENPETPKNDRWTQLVLITLKPKLLDPRQIRNFQKLAQTTIPEKESSQKENESQLVQNLVQDQKSLENVPVEESASEQSEEVEKPKEEIRYFADRIYGSEEKDRKGYRRIFLFGHVRLEFAGDYQLEAEEVSLKVDEEDEARELVALGSVVLIHPNGDRITGSKILYYPKTQRAEIFDPKGYRKPFYIEAEKAHRVSAERYVFHRGHITSENLTLPHYSLKYSKTWLFSEQYLWVQNLRYRVGNTDIFYLPFYLDSLIETRLRIVLGYEKGLDWFLHQTLLYMPGKTAEETYDLVSPKKSIESSVSDGMAFLFKADYYQKMGVYFGSEFVYSKKHSFFLDFGLAYDRALKHIGGKELLTNVFDQDGDGDIEESNNLRWNVRGKSNVILLSGSILQSSLNFSFERESDPYFLSQFSARRKTRFDEFHFLYQLANFDETTREIDLVSNSSKSKDQKISASLNNTVWKVNLSLSGDWGYVLKKDETLSPLPLNPYENDYYKQYKNIFTFPQVLLSYSDSWNILDSSTTDEEEEAVKKESEETEEKSEEKKEFQKEETDERTISEEGKNDEDRIWELKLPLQYGLSSRFTETKSYQTAFTNQLDSDRYNTTNNVNLGTPFEWKYGFFGLKIQPKGNVNHYLQKTKNPDSNEESNDREKTYGLWSINFLGGISFQFFQDYEYWNLLLSSNVNYSKTGRFDKVVREGKSYKNETGLSETIGMDASLEFVKSTFKINFSDNLYISRAIQNKIEQGNLSRQQALKDQKGNLTYSFRSELVPYVTLSDTFVYSRRFNFDLSNRLDLDFKILGRRQIVGLFYLNRFQYQISWFDDFRNSRSSYLQFTWTLDFNLGRNWNFLLKSSSRNQSLYRYSSKESKKYGLPKRDFFQDLLDSFNFFDPNARKRSLFNLQNFNLTVRHDLYHWLFEFQLDFQLRKFRDSEYYFEPSISLVIYLKDFPTFRYPRVRRSFVRQ